MRDDKQLSKLVRITHLKKSQAEIRDHNTLFLKEIENLIIALKEQVTFCEVTFGLIAISGSASSKAKHEEQEKVLDELFEDLKRRVREILNYGECHHPSIKPSALKLELKLSGELGDENDSVIFDEIYIAAVELLNAIDQHYDALKMMSDEPVVAVDNKAAAAIVVDDAKKSEVGASDYKNAERAQRFQPKKRKSMHFFRFTPNEVLTSNTGGAVLTPHLAAVAGPVVPVTPAAAATPAAAPAPTTPVIITAPATPAAAANDDKNDDDVVSTISRSAASADTPMSAIPDTMTPVGATAPATPATATAPATPAAAAPATPVAVAAMEYVVFFPSQAVANARASLTAIPQFEGGQVDTPRRSSFS